MAQGMGVGTGARIPWPRCRQRTGWGLSPPSVAKHKLKGKGRVKLEALDGWNARLDGWSEAWMERPKPWMDGMHAWMDGAKPGWKDSKPWMDGTCAWMDGAKPGWKNSKPWMDGTSGRWQQDATQRRATQRWAPLSCRSRVR